MVIHGPNIFTNYENVLYLKGYYLVKFQSNLDEKKRMYSINSQNIALVWHKHGPIMVQSIEHYYILVLFQLHEPFQTGKQTYMIEIV